MVKNPRPHGEKPNKDKEKNASLKQLLEDATTIKDIREFLKEYTGLQ